MPVQRPTEAVLEATRDLDQRSVMEILEAIHAQDRVAVEAVGMILPAVSSAVEVLVSVLEGGGRWFNVGAGTSGRMGALDAAEIPPTFGLESNRVQAFIAGGERAMVRAIEDAEDDSEAAQNWLQEAGLGAGDAVLAISASGQTPFALGGVEAARAAGAHSIAITNDPNSPLARAAGIAIVPETGAEVIAGSTRMKAGLSQKMVLHLLSTTTMVRLGYVEGNLMTNLMPTSKKLRERRLRIVMEMSGSDEGSASCALDQCGGVIADAVRLVKR
jgi:N-acetylmuramic acid 6-phosphate etherase